MCGITGCSRPGRSFGGTGDGDMASAGGIGTEARMSEVSKDGGKSCCVGLRS